MLNSQPSQSIPLIEERVHEFFQCLQWLRSLQTLLIVRQLRRVDVEDQVV